MSVLTMERKPRSRIKRSTRLRDVRVPASRSFRQTRWLP